MASSRYDRIKHRCLRCGVVIDVQKSRARHVLAQHAARCDVATPEDLAAFAKTGRWPKPAKPSVRR